MKIENKIFVSGFFSGLTIGGLSLSLSLSLKKKIMKQWVDKILF